MSPTWSQLTEHNPWWKMNQMKKKHLMRLEPTTLTVSGTLLYTKKSNSNSIVGEAWPASESTTFSHISWTRVPSYRLRELARGKFLIKSGDITLLECVGEGT